jgi:hypothetical protein
LKNSLPKLQFEGKENLCNIKKKYHFIGSFNKRSERGMGGNITPDNKAISTSIIL